MIIDLRDIYLNNLSYKEYGALLSIYCKEHNIESDYQLLQFNNITYKALENKKLIKIIDDKYHLRNKGKELIEYLTKFKEDNNWSKSPTKTPFEEFWELFPSTDSHSVYKKTRNLKSNKKGCKQKYDKYLKSGDKHEDIIKALRFEIDEKKKTSTKDNKLSFMKNSYTWLNQREFEIILETMNESEEDDDWTSNVI